MKRKRQIFVLLGFIGCIAFLNACKEFIEPSITKRIVQAQAPGNNYQSTSYTINFWWSEVEDATSYRLQIVTPDFVNIGGLVLDTVVTGTKFSVNLDPGHYEWKVLAQNGSTQTQFSDIRSFTVIETSLVNQSVALSFPANDFKTNQAAVTFQWGNLFSATNYRIQIDTANFQSGDSVLVEKLLPGQQLNYTFPKNHTYSWRVRAENDKEQSKWSSVYQVTYDTTPPATVTLSQPDNNTTLPVPVSLSWGKLPAAANYKLYVYKSDSTTIYSSSYPLLLKNSSYSFTGGSSGDRLYWTVTALDALGNESKPASKRSFTIQ